MAHNITALIGSKQALAKLESDFGSPSASELTANLQILPLDERRVEALAEAKGTPVKGFSQLTAEIAEAIGSALDGAPALYIETEYFGGMGCQAAAFFEGNQLKWQGSYSDAAADAQKSRTSSGIFSIFHKPPPPIEPTKSPISQGLKMMGVVSGPDLDEFDTAGLGRFRSLASLGIKDAE